jgi:hypothetical protein
MSTELITDGSVLTYEWHRYLVRLRSITPALNGRAQVAVTVKAIDDDGADLGSYYDNGACDDDPESIEDCVFGIIFELAAKCWPEHERIERERAEVRLQREIERDASSGFDWERFDAQR